MVIATIILIVILIILVSINLTFTIFKNKSKAIVEDNQFDKEVINFLDKELSIHNIKSLEQLRNWTNEIDKKLDLKISNFTKSISSLEKEYIIFKTDLEKNITNLTKNELEQLRLFREQIASKISKELLNLKDENVKKFNEIQQDINKKMRDSINEKFDQSYKHLLEQLNKIDENFTISNENKKTFESILTLFTGSKLKGEAGESTLEFILNDIYPDQYVKQFNIKESRTVDFALKMTNTDLVIPIDSKFPTEDYRRYLNSDNNFEKEKNFKGVINQLKAFAKDISKKYIDPNVTTDFALMYLPSIGLYNDFITKELQMEIFKKHSVIVTSPESVLPTLSILVAQERTKILNKNSRDIIEGILQFYENISSLEEATKKLDKNLNTASKQNQDINNKILRIKKQVDKKRSLFEQNVVQKDEIVVDVNEIKHLEN